MKAKIVNAEQTGLDMRFDDGDEVEVEFYSTDPFIGDVYAIRLPDEPDLDRELVLTDYWKSKGLWRWAP